jgi:hypothetical protein
MTVNELELAVLVLVHQHVDDTLSQVLSELVDTRY